MTTCSSRMSAFSGSNVQMIRTKMPVRGATGAVMMKKGIHPTWHPEAKVICNGVEVMTVGGTKPTYNVDIYSGNHPFYQGIKTLVVMDEGQVNKFKKRFDLGELNETFTATAVEKGKDSVAAVLAKNAKGKGKKK